MNVPPDKLKEVIALVPAITADRVAALQHRLVRSRERHRRATVRDLIPALRAGAVGTSNTLNKICG
jgi:hypothetical protein